MDTSKIPKFKKLTDSQKRDFDYYLNLSKDNKSFQIIDLNRPEYESSSLEEWYFLWDTHGLKTKYKDMQQAFRLTQSKDSLNLTIKMWVEDIVECNKGTQPLLTIEEVYEYCKDKPLWVWKSFIGQIKKQNVIFSFQNVDQ